MKYRFEIFYSIPPLKRLSEQMAQLGIETGEISFQEVLTFSSRADIPISKLKEVIKLAFTSYQYTILRIEGGKIE